MQYRYLTAFLIFLVLVAKTNAQISRGGDSSQTGNVRVRVVYSNERAAGRQLRVRLMNGAGSETVADYFTTDNGTVEFNGVPLGDYHIVVSGDGIEEADSGEFEVDRRKMSQSIFITVHSVNASNANQSGVGSQTVAALDLSIPDDARKELDKATKAMADQDWTSAQQRLSHAIELYPQYALAYSNLGLVYAHLKDSAHEREALEKALQLDDHMVPASVNLAKMCFREGNSVKAESLLEGAVRADPSNAEALALLAQAQLLNKQYDAAIISAHSVHSLPHLNFAVVHYIAARALERENRPQDAIVELQVFLKEEPTGARAEQVRKEISQIEKQATH
jgi:tetratricopeptide (TPR) repeat protein